MKTFRIVLGILAILPVALLIDHIFFPTNYYAEGSLSEMAYMVFGIPILIFNLWAWIYPEIIEIYFLGKKDQAN